MSLRAKWIAAMALGLSVLCACRPSGGHSAITDPAGQIKTVTVAQLEEWFEDGRPLILIDVREENEWKAGHAAKAILIPRWTLSARIASVAPDKSARIVLYCASGRRSASAAETLQEHGYTNVFSLTGGLKSYAPAGLPVQK